jgi:hypothetical protein
VPPAQAPAITNVTCSVAYQDNPKLATVGCTAAVTGTSTSLTWQLNGIPAGSGLIMNSAQFTQNTNLTVLFTACNGAACANQVRAVQVVFPTGGTPTPTATPTATGVVAAFPDLDVVCGVVPVPDVQSNINCTASFTGTFTSITWTASGTNNPSQITGVKTYSTSVSNDSGFFVLQPGQVTAAQSPTPPPPPTATRSHTFSITANVCNGPTCRSFTEQVTVTPRYQVILDWDYIYSFTCDGNPVCVHGEVNSSAPQWVWDQLANSSLLFLQNGVPESTVGPPQSWDDNEAWWWLTVPCGTFSANFAAQQNLAPATLAPLDICGEG